MPKIGLYFIKKIFINIFFFLVVISFSTLVNFKFCIDLQRFYFINVITKFSAIAIMIFIIFLSFILICAKVYRPSKPALIIIGLYLYIVSITLLNGGDILEKALAANVFLTLGLDILLYYHKGDMFRCFLKWWNIVIVLNFFSVIFYINYDGFNYFSQIEGKKSFYYLLGYDNGHIVSLLPIMCLNILLYEKEKKKKNLFMVIIGVLNIFITFSATSMFIIFLWAMLCIVYDFSKKISKYIFNEKFWIMLIVGFFCFFILFRGYSYFSEILYEIIGKDVTSTRENLYSIGYEYIKKNWLFGYGYLKGKTWINGYNSPHCIFLNYLLTGGIIAFTWFLFIIYKTIYNARINLPNKQVAYLICAILSFIVGAFTEGYDIYVTYYLFNALCLITMNWSKFTEMFFKKKKD